MNYISFNQAMEYLNDGFYIAVKGKYGVVSLKNEANQDRLIFQSENGGKNVCLIAPFLECPNNVELRQALELRLLHLNGDIDSLGTLRISLNSKLNQYLLCDGYLAAENLEDFVGYVEAVLNAANYLQAELSQLNESSLDLNREQEERGIDASFLKA
jgi:hypothetical protein